MTKDAATLIQRAEQLLNSYAPWMELWRDEAPSVMRSLLALLTARETALPVETPEALTWRCMWHGDGCADPNCRDSGRWINWPLLPLDAHRRRHERTSVVACTGADRNVADHAERCAMTDPTPREQAIRQRLTQWQASETALMTYPDVEYLLTLLDQLRAEGPRLADAAEMLWVVLANVSGGDWTKQTAEWQEAAARWRDNYFTALRAEGQPPQERTNIEWLQKKVEWWRAEQWTDCKLAYSIMRELLRELEQPTDADVATLRQQLAQAQQERDAALAVAADASVGDVWFSPDDYYSCEEWDRLPVEEREKRSFEIAERLRAHKRSKWIAQHKTHVARAEAAEATVASLRDQVAQLKQEIVDIDEDDLRRWLMFIDLWQAEDTPAGTGAKYLRELLQQLRVMGDVPVSNTPSTSKDRHGVVAARGADPDPSPDQLLRDELLRDRDTWSQACASAIRELREEREQLRSLIQTWRQEGLTARRPMDHDAINACADDLEALLPPDAPQEK